VPFRAPTYLAPWGRRRSGQPEWRDQRWGLGRGWRVGCGGHRRPPLCPPDRRDRPESERGL